MREITSRQNALVSEYRALARRRQPHATSVLLEGAHLVEEGLQAGVPVRSAAITRALLGQPAIEDLAGRLHRAGADVAVVTDAVMKAMSPTPSPSGLIALADIEPVPLDRAFAGAPQLVLLLFDVQDPGNAGAIVRSAEAFDATSVVFCGASVDPFGWKALRGAMGSAFRLPVVRGADGAAAVAAARAAELWVMATVPAGGHDVAETDLTRPLACLFGGEGRGLDPSLVATADETVSIPMARPVESLNVAVATAILSWEAHRQRALQRDRGRHA